MGCTWRKERTREDDEQDDMLDHASQFGVDVDKVLCDIDVRYDSAIPVVLGVLLTYLRSQNAFQLEGIFRISANDDECSSLKLQLSRNIHSMDSIDEIMQTCEDVHCASTLIKRWFRQLPTPILQPILPQIESEMEEAAFVKLINELPEKYLSLLLWYLDVCLEVTAFTTENKMTMQNISLVMSPNLAPLSLDDHDALTALTLSQKVNSFIHRALQWREKNVSFSSITN